MSYKVKTLPKFDKNLKKLIKKYPSLKKEFVQLISEIKQNPTLGTSLGNNCYKIRLSISSKGKGKSGGARIITHIVLIEKIVYLLTIYDKNEKETLTNKEIVELLKQII